MKHDDTSDVLKKIEEAIESMKKRMYEIKKENNPSLDWNSFCKNFDSMNDSNDVSLKNKLFQEEIDKIISLEMNLEHRRLLNSIKASINFETLKIKEENKITLFISKILIILAHFVCNYFISVVVFGLLSYFIIIPIWYIFLLSLITATLFMLCEMPSRNIKAFIYDPFLPYKLLITYMLIMIFINMSMYQIFESSLIWLLFIIISAFLNKILSRNIHKIWWKF